LGLITLKHYVTEDYGKMCGVGINFIVSRDLNDENLVELGLEVFKTIQDRITPHLV
jgi:hypothetical protein